MKTTLATTPLPAPPLATQPSARRRPTTRRERSLLTLLALGALVTLLLPSPAVLAVVLLSAIRSIAIACSRAPLIAVLALPAPSFSLTGQSRVPSRREHRIKQPLAL